MGKKYFNGLKTFGLFVVLWVVLLGVGSFVSGGAYLWFFVGLGLVGTFYGYWNSANLAIRAMHARPGRGDRPRPRRASQRYWRSLPCRRKCPRSP